jgi:tetratricopeptide (TPR) repeat protein
MGICRLYTARVCSELSLSALMLSVFRDAFDVLAASAVWGSDGDESQSLLSEMLVHNMVEWNEQTRRYRLHDLTQVFADKNLDFPQGDAARQRHAMHYATMAMNAYDVMASRNQGSVKRGFTLLATDWANIVAGQSWAAERAGEDKNAARLCIDYSKSAAIFRLFKRDPLEMVRWRVAATRAAQYLNDHEEELSQVSLLAGAYKVVWARLADNGRSSPQTEDPLDNLRRAVDCYEQAAALARKLGDKERESDALHELMDLYELLGETSKAIEIGERALAILQEG